MVIYEAARAIINVKNVSARELAPAVSVLQLFLSSPKPTLRFAAVRTLNKIAISHPQALKTCNLDMENLITDANRSIATLAITTLLKTGTVCTLPGRGPPRGHVWYLGVCVGGGLYFRPPHPPQREVPSEGGDLPSCSQGGGLGSILFGWSLC